MAKTKPRTCSIKRPLLKSVYYLSATALLLALNTSSVEAAPVDLKDNPIVKDIQLIVNFLSAGVGIVVVGVIIMGGIQYTMAGDKPEALSVAKQRITNGLIAFLAFMFTYAFLQWLIPGGVF